MVEVGVVSTAYITMTAHKPALHSAARVACLFFQVNWLREQQTGFSCSSAAIFGLESSPSLVKRKGLSKVRNCANTTCKR
jgi:hypothetical protein